MVATDASLAGYGRLVDDPRRLSRSRSRAGRRKGWRPVDADTGDQGGVTEGLFEFAWRGETLYARNHAVGDSYLFGWSTWPEEAAAGPAGRASGRWSGAPTITRTAVS